MSEEPASSAFPLPPGLFLRLAGHFSSSFFLEPDGSFGLQWSDSAADQWLQGSGRATEIIETIDGRQIKYEIRLHGDFACGLPAADADDAASGAATVEELPKQLQTTVNKAKGKVKKGKAKKKKKSARKEGTARGAASAGATAASAAASAEATPAPTTTDAKAAVASEATTAATAASTDGTATASTRVYSVVEVHDGPYVIHETIACPPEAGESPEEMRRWIADAAAAALQNELGAATAQALRAPGFPFNHGVEVEWDDDEEQQATASNSSMTAAAEYSA